ncbi:hypothetical protein [Culicoidibacter larvae]|uniref:Uncharacterized protein n=1 Tax=Culicoidibacter larvae TaxID=2579976 RepID=A0A5R8Q8K1_9FIRM|nr:hypothetical protein [Culicoidibacter larvae]TLG72042.1 hypothetical protein FEZ08_09420 [Culicoidibacter larvae]
MLEINITVDDNKYITCINKVIDPELGLVEITQKQFEKMIETGVEFWQYSGGEFSFDNQKYNDALLFNKKQNELDELNKFRAEIVVILGTLFDDECIVANGKDIAENTADLKAYYQECRNSINLKGEAIERPESLVQLQVYYNTTFKTAG